MLSYWGLGVQGFRGWGFRSIFVGVLMGFAGVGA